jgi:hypothetical protein
MRSHVNVGWPLMVTARRKQRSTAAIRKRRPTVLVQVKISRRAANLLRKRARNDLRTQASYLRRLIYRDLHLTNVEG